MAQFASALFVFFLFALFPLINLIGYAASCATVAFLTMDAANRAASATSFSEALSNMKAAANTIAAGGLGRFARLKNAGGYGGCGCDLYVIVTDTNNKQVAYFGPNSPYPKPQSGQEGNYLFEYKVRSNFQISPFLNLSAVPFIGSVPAVGRDAPFSYSVDRNVEQEDGSSAVAMGNWQPLSGASSGSSGSGGSSNSGGGSSKDGGKGADSGPGSDSSPDGCSN